MAPPQAQALFGGPSKEEKYTEVTTTLIKDILVKPRLLIPSHPQPPQMRVGVRTEARSACTDTEQRLG